jgi:hypothetical protein
MSKTTRRRVSPCNVTGTVKGGYTLVTLLRTVTQYRDCVDGNCDHVTYQKSQPPATVFFLCVIFSLPLPLLSLRYYHQLVTRAQTTVLNWCKEQLYIPLCICMNCQSNKHLFKKIKSWLRGNVTDKFSALTVLGRRIKGMIRLRPELVCTCNATRHHRPFLSPSLHSWCFWLS